MIGARRWQWRGKKKDLSAEAAGEAVGEEEEDGGNAAAARTAPRSLSQAAADSGDTNTLGSNVGSSTTDSSTIQIEKLKRGIARPISGASGATKTPLSSSSTSASASATTPIGISPHWSYYCTDRCGVMWKPIRVYVVWYGYFSEAQKHLVRMLTRSFSPSDDPAVTVPLWWNINRLYYDQQGRFISSNVTWVKEKDDTAYSRGKNLWLDDVEAVVATAIATSELPYDEDGVYFVLSDQYVNQQWSATDKFCATFCGWHFFGSAPSQGSFIYSWHPTSCITSGIRTASKAPKKDVDMDVLLSVFAHKLNQPPSPLSPLYQCPTSCITSDIRTASKAPNEDVGMDVHYSPCSPTSSNSHNPSPPLACPPTLIPVPHVLWQRRRNEAHGAATPSTPSPILPPSPSLPPPHPPQCPTSCIASDIRTASKAPNRDVGMDALLSVFAHELAEAASSPFVGTWFDEQGEENADKCAWK
ncbi:unnamed protein product [Closterium sp. NIES-54]